MKYHCGVCLYIYKWLGFSLKSNKCPVLLRAKASGKAPWENYSKRQRPVREGSQSELFSPDLMLASRHWSWSKMRTQGSPVVFSQSNFANAFARFLGRLPLLIARFICHWQHSQTSPNSKRSLECVDSKYGS